MKAQDIYSFYFSLIFFSLILFWCNGTIGLNTELQPRSHLYCGPNGSSGYQWEATQYAGDSDHQPGEDNSMHGSPPAHGGEDDDVSF
jgi:hypothetical protein